MHDLSITHQISIPNLFLHECGSEIHPHKYCPHDIACDSHSVCVCVCVCVCVVASTLTETKQFYTLYNTLEDQKEFMEKEVSI